jgi:peptidoglycan/xylan/chitin deacetylase (PgdA/CDA1 family)
MIEDQVTERNGRTLAILGFHQIGVSSEWDSWFYIPEDTFVKQLRYLQENDWQVIDLATFLRSLETPEILQQRSALLTFDDGCRKFLDVALPCLQQFEYPSVHFVPTAYIGKLNFFDAGIEPEEPILTWDDLRKLEQAGVSIESHAVTHRPFSKMTEVEQEEELLLSKIALEEGLQKRVETFAFPQGDEGADTESVAKALVRTGYKAAFLYGGGPVCLPVASPYRLTRLAMGPDTNMEAELSKTPGCNYRS